LRGEYEARLKELERKSIILDRREETIDEEIEDRVLKECEITKERFDSLADFANSLRKEIKDLYKYRNEIRKAEELMHDNAMVDSLREKLEELENKGITTETADEFVRAKVSLRKATEQIDELKTKNLNLEWQNPRSPYIVGMFHDLCKIEDYIYGPDGWTYNNDKILKGHGDKSIMLLSQFINLTEEEILCIRFHMGAYEKEDWDSYDKAIKKYETVLWTHTADMYAAKVLNK
jgi:hypothetical protein